MPCLFCYQPKLDGHLTCGRLECPEHLARDLVSIRVGALAVAVARTGVCEVGERAVCYERYTLSGRPGWSFIFEGGRYDGFSPTDVRLMLRLTGGVCESAADYYFINAPHLEMDFRRGRFAACFR